MAGKKQVGTRRSSLPKALNKSDVFKECTDGSFKKISDKIMDASLDIIAQDRAVRAINMGLGIRRPGYNIYVAGIEGTGKTSVIQKFLEEWSKDAPAPNDWVYLYNFTTPEVPKAAEMPRGEARLFKKRMDQLVKSLKSEIPQALQSEHYENSISVYISAASERKNKLYTELEKLAKSYGFVIKSTKMGIETIPFVEGRTLSEKEYSKLGADQKNEIEQQRGRLEPEVLDFARKVRNIEIETGSYVENLRRDLCERIIGELISPVKADYKDIPQILEFLDQVTDDILENIPEFVPEDEPMDPEEAYYHMSAGPDKDIFKRYSVNVFLDNGPNEQAPVIIESNPTYYNLFGKIEKNVEHGMYLTDFSMIKSGAIHRANGGYLVLNAIDIFRTPSIWDTLKRILRNRMGFIEDMGEQYSLLPTSGLRPEPIPLDMKVILIGTDDIYHILFSEDEEFHKIFKIKADFDFKMDRNRTNIQSYGNFIATRSKKEGLLSFHASGMAAVVEFGSRLVEDQRLLSTQFGEIKDLTIEADFIAREAGAKQIKRQHVEQALNEKYYRLNLQEENLLDLVRNEDILLTVDGERVGQVNGLAVYDYGDYSFGKIGRITCTTSVNDDSIINVERASRLSGKIHDKGIFILSGFLSAILAQEQAMGIGASVCFEQSYGMIDGDSASTAELIAVISALSGIPVPQNFAITGSINQLGDIQPVGGVNEKIEGFHKVCKIIGKKGPYSVVLPVQNVSSLMLHQDARQSVEKGYLKVYPVRHFWQAFELVTGVPFGLKDVHSKTKPPKGSALAIIHEKLDKIRKEHEATHHSPHHDHGNASVERTVAKTRT